MPGTCINAKKTIEASFVLSFNEQKQWYSRHKMNEFMLTYHEYRAVRSALQVTAAPGARYK